MSTFLKEELGRQKDCNTCKICDHKMNSPHVAYRPDMQAPRGFLVFKYATSSAELKKIVSDFVAENPVVQKCIEVCLNCSKKSINIDEQDVEFGSNTAKKLNYRRDMQKEKIKHNTQMIKEKIRQEEIIAQQKLREAEQRLG